MYLGRFFGKMVLPVSISGIVIGIGMGFKIGQHDILASFFDFGQAIVHITFSDIATGGYSLGRARPAQRKK